MTILLVAFNIWCQRILITRILASVSTRLMRYVWCSVWRRPQATAQRTAGSVGTPLAHFISPQPGYFVRLSRRFRPDLYQTGTTTSHFNVDEDMALHMSSCGCCTQPHHTKDFTRQRLYLTHSTRAHGTRQDQSAYFTCLCQNISRRAAGLGYAAFYRGPLLNARQLRTAHTAMSCFVLTCLRRTVVFGVRTRDTHDDMRGVWLIGSSTWSTTYRISATKICTSDGWGFGFSSSSVDLFPYKREWRVVG